MARWRLTPRFTIRTLLVVTLLVAIALAVWRIRPSPVLTVEVTASGTVLIDQREIPNAELSATFGGESARRKLWFFEPMLKIRAHYGASHQNVLQLVELGKASGFERFILLKAATSAQATSATGPTARRSRLGCADGVIEPRDLRLESQNTALLASLRHGDVRPKKDCLWSGSSTGTRSFFCTIPCGPRGWRHCCLRDWRLIPLPIRPG